MSSHTRSAPVCACLCVLLSCAGTLTLPAHASEEATAQELTGMVVTAAGFEQVIEDAPASISVITREQLETQPFRDLTDALRNVEGVSVTGAAGESDIYIRGMPGEYTLILVDGKRQNTRDSRTNGDAGFEQSFIPPLEAIERIEVVRGPMSSLYGSDAMGGVINIITRKVPRAWGGSVGMDATVQQHDDSGNALQGQFYVGGPLMADTLGLQVWGRQLRRAEDEIENGFPERRESSLSARLALAPNPFQDIVVEAGREWVRRDNTVGRTLAGDGATDSYSRNPRSHWSAAHEGRWEWGQTNIAAYEETTRQQRYSRAADGLFEARERVPEVRNRTVDAKLALPLENHNLVIGGQWRDSLLIDQNPGERDGVNRRFQINQKALFAEDEWRLGAAFALTGGLRLDRHQEYGNHWSPRLYGVWHASEGLTVKGGVSRGFRAPEIRQIAPGYAYTTGGRNCSYGPEGTCAVIIGDPNLAAETSTSTELSAMWDNRAGLHASVTVFDTRFRDKVTDVQPLDAEGNYIRWEEDPNYRVYYWTNVDEARIRGVELGSEYRPTTAWTLSANYTFTDSEQLSGNYAGYPLARTPRSMANGRIEWKAHDRLRLWFAFRYHGREINAQLRAGGSGTPIETPNGRTVREYGAWTTADMGASWQLGQRATLNAALYNLADRRLDYDTYKTTSDGRRLWLGIDVEL